MDEERPIDAVAMEVLESSSVSDVEMNLAFNSVAMPAALAVDIADDDIANDPLVAEEERLVCDLVAVPVVENIAFEPVIPAAGNNIDYDPDPMPVVLIAAEENVVDDHVAVRPEIEQINRVDNPVIVAGAARIDPAPAATTIFTCIVCSRTFNRKGNLKRHYVTHTGERPFDCGECGLSFSLKSTLLAHKITHTDERPFPCNSCTKTFRTAANLWDHMISHQGLRPYTCEYCGRKFSRKKNLQRHQDMKGQKYACKLCEKVYTQNSGLKNHEKKCHVPPVRDLRKSSSDINYDERRTLLNWSEVDTFPCNSKCKTQGNSSNWNDSRKCHTFKNQGVKKSRAVNKKKCACKKKCQIHKKPKNLAIKSNKRSKNCGRASKFACKQCDKVYKYKYSLIRHSAKHP